MTILDNELVRHPDCNCHQCTWLRANQFDRAFMPKPTPEPEKCIGGSDCHHFDKPKDEVEEKINFILDNQPMPIGRSLKELRELVELVRKK